MNNLNRYGATSRCLLRLRENDGHPLLSDEALIATFLPRFPEWAERPGEVDFWGLSLIVKELGLARSVEVLRSYRHVLARYRAGSAVVVLTERAPQQGTDDLRFLRYSLLLVDMDEEAFSAWCPYPTGQEETFTRVPRARWDEWQSIAAVLDRPWRQNLTPEPPAEQKLPAPNRAESTVALLPSGSESLVPRELTSGFGTIVAEERSLRTLVELCRERASGRHAENLVRILSHHLVQIDAVLALLVSRRALLPKPARFRGTEEPNGTLYRHTAGLDGPAALPELRNRHLKLIARLEALIASMGIAPQREPLLREAHQRHEEMAWMLAALIAEDSSRRPRTSLFRREKIPFPISRALTAHVGFEPAGRSTSINSLAAQ